MQGHCSFLPQLHCGTMPFLGMVASVAVVVQVLIVLFFRALVLLLLFQAGSSFMSSFISFSSS